MDSLTAELRYLWRRLRRAPGFTSVAVLTLAFGIGANAALFSLVNGILFRSLPIENDERLVYISGVSQPENRSWIALPAAYYQAVIESHLPQIQSFVLADPLIAALSGPDQSDVVAGELVSGNYFGAFGVAPVLGRLLQPSDDAERGMDTPIVISERLWHRSYEADPGVVGRPVSIAGQSLVIIGIAPASFKGTWLPTLLTADIWAPVRASARLRTVQGAVVPESHRLFGVLAPGATRSQVDAAVATIGRAVSWQGPRVVLGAKPARDGMLFEEFQQYGRLIALGFLVLSALVFLIANANLTNLILARGAARTAEIAVRLSLGASRGRIVQLLMAETFIVAALGGAAGVAVAVGLTKLMTIVPLPVLDGLSINFDPSPDWRVFGYALLLTLVAAIAVGLWPARYAARTEPVRVLVAAGTAGATTRSRRSATWLVAAQLAMSMTLLIAGGLYARSAFKSLTFDPGYDVTHQALASLDLSMTRVDEPAGRRLLTQALEAARRVPGISSAAIANQIPVVRSGRVAPVDTGETAQSKGVSASVAGVSPMFFEAIGLQIRSGRSFTPDDGPSAPKVAIVSERLAARLWPGRDPLGQTLSWRTYQSPTSSTFIARTVIGVAANTAGSLSSDAPASQIWIPAAQDYSPRTTLVVRTNGDPHAILDPLRRALRGVGRDVAVVDVQTLRDAVGALLFPIRLTALILGVLGALGFSIALIGVYGVMAYAVGRRTREFGIHRALGATPRQIHVLVLRQGVRMLVVGLAPGLVLALAAASLLRHLLYGITPFDPPTFIAVPAILFLAGLAAAYFPARRAARVEPVVALRES